MEENQKIALKVLSILPKTKSILNSKNIQIEEKKGIGNIVTSVDKQLEAYLKHDLLKMFPNSQIIAEETAGEIKEESGSGLIFIVDPLDGTTNYTNGWPHTVAIGIANNNDLIAGIIYDILSNKVYTGIKGIGVTECDIDNISEQKVVKQPIYNNEQIKKSPISFDTPYGNKAYETTQKMCLELYQSGASLKTVGPISLDVLKTALGKENRPTDYNVATWHAEVRAWDLAAATCILRELNGEIIGQDGKPLSIQTLTSPTAKIAFIACGNEKLRSELFSKYKEASRDIEQEPPEL